jgi:hypothetical protein
MATSSAQKLTYDIVSYTPPPGWTNELKNNQNTYTIINNKNGSWCQIFIIKSTISKGSIDADFKSEWQELAVKSYNPAGEPQLRPVKEFNEWQTKTGIGKFIFKNKEATVMLTSISGYSRCISIVATYNSGDYVKDIDALLASVTFKKEETVSNTQQATTVNASFIGSWGKSNMVSQVNNRFGNYSYNKQQYTFNANGTYSFTGKTYNEQYSETMLIKENGSFTINGNSITITPKTSIIEAWSKKNGADNWNQLKSSQKRPLEIVTYQFSIDNSNLLLQTAKQTERDGRFNYGNTYTYGPPGTFTPIQLPVN